MIEILLCSLVTIVPDFLYRRYRQGKRIGREITLYTVWYELRWGITLCLMLTVSLIALIFYNHPSSNAVISYFRTVPILIEGSGRVAEVYVDYNDEVQAGDPIFRIDSSKQQAALNTGKRRVAEIDAAIVVARTELAAADGRIQEAESAYRQAVDELQTKTELRARNDSTVSAREIERLQNAVDGRQGSVSAAKASKQSVEAQVSSLLPAQRASAEAALAEAQVELDKTVVYAGVTGTVEQFTLRVGDLVNQFSRPAGILLPKEAGRKTFEAGFGQIEAQVMKPGMIAELACISKPFTVIPMVVTDVQDFIAAGQLRPTDQLIDPLQMTAPGTIVAFLQPLYEGQLDGVPPGSRCIANAYTSNHERLASEDLGTLERIWLHVIDAVGIVHAMILRVKALVMPIQQLVFQGH